MNNIVIVESERQIKGGKFDWILLDMPCSGMKCKFSRAGNIEA